ncbi:sugar ABC transporter substrate-binding protein [Nocardioides nitrophenolicus]|uniref:sugar ABC transporter substrate-binding protein n=1 Tax=Nocardioides nitrophenolicus TaxID=60489 RepID=UPI00195A1A80|nr:sugar ABC transporter substrate-binding protein [Nocardioides nitrophenolicus]MBM7516635.1 ribose transport system substrate-binding protein [Nocardioides nitrophenolicus]
MLHRPALSLAAAGVAACLAMTGCSSGVSDTASASTEIIDAPVSDPADLKIAYFSAGTSNAYLQAAIDEAKKTAGELGADLDVFDGAFDAQVQFDQMQQALTSGKYNAFVVEPNDGNLVCDILTQQAPEKEVLVSVFNLPICGRATNLGEETHQPGTITYVGGQTLDVYQAWVQDVIDSHPDGAKIALVSGPDLNANTLCFFEAAKAFAKVDGFEVVAQQTTDYTTPKAFDAAQTIVQANPDVDVIMSNFSGMTRGVVEAVGNKDVEIYDFGGDTWALENVASGKLTSSVMMLPRLETREAIEAVAEYVQGKDVPVFINLAESDSLPGTPFATKQNVGEFTAEY